MNYAEITVAVAAKIAAMGGMDGGCLRYEPQSVDTTPMAYLLFDSRDHNFVRQARTFESSYQMLLRVVIQWQENEQAELELMPWVDSVPEALESDLALVREGVRVAGCTGGFVTINGVLFRVLDFDVISNASGTRVCV